MLPFSYAVRNLSRSRTRLLQTVGGSAMVVLLVMLAIAVNHGMKRVLASSGSPHNVILLGAGSEESIQRSEIAESVPALAAASVEGIAEVLGERAVSPEIHHMSYLALPDGKRAQALFRGVTPGGLRVHPEVRITSGNFPATGEVIAGGLAWRKLGVTPETLKPGATITVDGRKLRLAGTFAAPGTVMESEFWMPLGDLRVLAKRDTLSCVVLRMRDPADVAEAGVFAKQRLDLELSALRESDYYSRLSAFFRPLRVMTWITAGLIAAGALFGGINTLYSAFASRVREMATLQAIGYGRGALLISLVQETTLASLAGTLTACVAAKWFFDGLELPFSIGVFTLEIGPAAALGALLSGGFLGLIGALPPAYRCLKPALVAALRMG